MILFDPENIPANGKPHLLLDVDGVLNVVDRSRNPRVYDHRRVIAGGVEWPIKIRKEMGDWLFELITHLNPVWCTTWDDDANHCIAPLLGLPQDIPVIPVEHLEWDRRSPVHRKLPAVEEYMQELPFVFVDDEFTQADLRWAQNRDLQVAPTMFVRTDERQGLLEYQVRRIIAWAAEVNPKEG